MTRRPKTTLEAFRDLREAVDHLIGVVLRDSGVERLGDRFWSAVVGWLRRGRRED